MIISGCCRHRTSFWLKASRFQRWVLWYSSNAAGPSNVDLETSLQKLSDRGCISGTFPDTIIRDWKTLKNYPPIVYVGFDPTADSLHIGHLGILTGLLRLWLNGFSIILVIGGATALLGDPSGTGARSQRQILDQNIVKSNSYALARQLDHIFQNFHDNLKYLPQDTKIANKLEPVKIVNNVMWYQNMNVISFMAGIGHKFRLRHMLHKDTVQLRLAPQGGGISFPEFSYQVFQAFDWLQLYEQHGCLLQLGGSDQLGNMHSGHDLISAFHQDKSAVGLLVPLLTTVEGHKLGKSEGNAVSLDKAKSSAFDLYQFCIRVQDFDVHKLLLLYSFYSTDHVDQIMAKHWKAPHERHAQQKLADQVTVLVHGKEGLESARGATAALYQGSNEDLFRMSPEEVKNVFAHLPRHDIQFSPGLTLLDLAMKIQCFRDAEEAETVIRNGGLYVNHIRCSEPNAVLVNNEHILPSGFSTVRSGKKRNFLIQWID